ncbi:nuclear transport factor 2 family protein [Actinomycetospora sp. CA-084318]|uniref:nuclear transport factor 2 family protein n=1 Tax=Actinomycetospora sp. CA-084318 TaxID=3239892 RepID=UPI003D97C806
MSADADLVAELADLRRRVERLESESAIHALRNRFHEFVNTDRWDEIGGLFAEDAVLDYSYLGSASGRAEITAFFAAIPRLLPAAEGRPFVRQFIHGHDVEVDGDTARGTSFLLATPIYHGESFLLAGRFTDTYVRRGEVWSFASVTLDVDYSVPIREGWAGEDRHRMRL